MMWGGDEEKRAEQARGNKDAKNWQDEAQKVVETAMRLYWNSRPTAPQSLNVHESNPAPINNNDSDSDSNDIMAEYERHRRTLISQDIDEDWNSELRRYLKDMPNGVDVNTDLVDWWSNNAKLYPTLSRIALDVLPSQASSVPCERAFSSAKLTGSDRRSRMKAEIFEILQILKAKWRGNLINL
ncbi:hypothetical protein M378DRAFT_47871, partial [Amanita muscaria Koide BX008]